jgi:cell division protease FtsH
MCQLMGGRAAEEIVNGEPATGALNDLERLTRMAYSMVQYYGMSPEVGEMSFYDSTGSRGYELTKPYSEKTAEKMDAEVKRIIGEAHDMPMSILRSHMDGFTAMAELLLEKEVIFSDDISRILGPKVKPEGESEAESEEKPEENTSEQSV